jgi:hypothetical protein
MGMNSRQPVNQGGDWNKIEGNETNEIGERKRPEDARIQQQPLLSAVSSVLSVSSRSGLRVPVANL